MKYTKQIHIVTMRSFSLLIAIFLLSADVRAQTLLRVPDEVWKNLTQFEQASLQKRFFIEPVSTSSYGVILDNQGVDRSTPGSQSGAALGQAIGSASYIDNAFRPLGSYSAKTHLAAMLLGGLLGSSLDRPAQNSFQFRYAIRHSDGNIAYYDITSIDPFRHPAGICVLLPAVSPAPEQSLCSLSVESIRSRYFLDSTASANTKPHPQTLEKIASESIQRSGESQVKVISNNNDIVLCKVGLTAPVTTSLEKCISINGETIR